ncbi:conjugative transfer ATPase [Hahella ganghwensis]|uniref:conjugative transfer ATPase n=1 Tax=Hahella ganghwensis TaxID=286420 RepID=UPI0003743BB4|nr:conjugative transfer ATPase [Hahella ganghwensis]
MTLYNKCSTAIRKLSGSLPFKGEEPLTAHDFDSLFRAERSFTGYLPWRQYEDGVFLFDDDVSVGAAFEIFPADVDGKPETVKKMLEASLDSALGRIPERTDNPWILQVYLNDEPIISLIDQLRAYASPDAKKTKLHEVFMKELEEHIYHLANPEGLFFDDSSGVPWRGIIRRVRCCLYRIANEKSHYKNGKPVPGVMTPTAENHQVVRSFCRALEQAGIRHLKYDDSDLRTWMFPWFSPHPVGFKDAYEYMAKHPFKKNQDDPAYFDLAQSTLIKRPSCDEKGVFKFCGQYQRFMALQPLDSPPSPGIITSERSSGAKTTSVSTWDQMPQGSIFVMTIVIESQLQIKNHLHVMGEKGGAVSPKAAEAQKQIEEAKRQLARNKKLYRLYAGVYLRADSEEALQAKCLDAANILSDAGLKPIEPEDEPIGRDSYLRNLPMVYRPDKDKVSKRARMTYSHHVARLLPLFGRSTGTGNPGILYFNKIGQPLMYDKFNKRDRTKTAHGLIFGSTGAGKSASINYKSLYYAAMFNHRQFIIEKGQSFKLLAKYFKRQGKTVSYLRFTAKKELCPSLPPFVETRKALEQLEEDDNYITMDVTDWLDAEIDEEDEERFYLGEMEQATLIMISNANKDELSAIKSDERQLIRECIVKALEKAVREGNPHARVTDLVEVMEDLVTNPPKSAEGKPLYDQLELQRIRKFSRSLKGWTSGLKGMIFNRYGESWKDVDLTVIDMGILAKPENNDMLTLAMITLVNTITGIGEKYQYTDNRETVVWTDEGHVLTTNPTIVGPFVFGVKTWRKLAIWLIQATQNLDDYPNEAKKMLNLAEWWYCLNMAPNEINEMKTRFRTQMTDEQVHLCMTTQKQPGAYVEGVVMSDKLTMQYRSVIPALPLCLAMTDGDEKKKIQQIKKDLQANDPKADDLDAALAIADRIKEQREWRYA